MQKAESLRTDKISFIKDGQQNKHSQTGHGQQLTQHPQTFLPDLPQNKHSRAKERGGSRPAGGHARVQQTTPKLVNTVHVSKTGSRHKTARRVLVGVGARTPVRGIQRSRLRARSTLPTSTRYSRPSAVVAAPDSFNSADMVRFQSFDDASDDADLRPETVPLIVRTFSALVGV